MQMGICLIFLADMRKYNAPKKADAASIIAGNTLGAILPILAAFGSAIIKIQPINASIIPNISLRWGLVPINTPINTIKRPWILLKT